jgi:lambda family phage portal protein
MDKWCKRGVCEVSGQYSFIELCWNIIRGTARDGEYVVEEIFAANNGFGYALRVIDGALLATWKNRPASAGVNAIKLGVEVDAFGKPVNYWFTKGGVGINRNAEPISASKIMHRFKIKRSDQVRGIPWAHAAMLSMHYSGEFALSALMAAKWGADNLGFFVSPDGSAPNVGDDTTADGTQLMNTEIGKFFTVPEGYDYRGVDSKYPNEVFDSFMKQIHRRMASGLNNSYPAICNDHSDLNYNSIRATQSDDRDQYRRHQRFFTEAWLNPIFERWLTFAIANGAITMPNGSALPMTKIDKFKAYTWQYRGWESNDPLKDMNAAKIAIQELRIDSRTAYAARAGRDIEDVFNELMTEESQPISAATAPPSPVINEVTQNTDGGNALP